MTATKDTQYLLDFIHRMRVLPKSSVVIFGTNTIAYLFLHLSVAQVRLKSGIASTGQISLDGLPPQTMRDGCTQLYVLATLLHEELMGLIWTNSGTYLWRVKRRCRDAFEDLMAPIIKMDDPSIGRIMN